MTPSGSSRASRSCCWGGREGEGVKQSEGSADTVFLALRIFVAVGVKYTMNRVLVDGDDFLLLSFNIQTFKVRRKVYFSLSYRD